MDAETLAEVLCNLEDLDPNNSDHWEPKLADAKAQLAAVADGDIAPWWEA